MPEGDGYKTVDAEVGDVSVLEEEEEDSFVDIDDILSTRSGLEGGNRGTGMVRKRVEVVTRSGKRAGRVAYGNDATGWSSNRGRSIPQSKTLVLPVDVASPSLRVRLVL